MKVKFFTLTAVLVLILTSSFCFGQNSLVDFKAPYIVNAQLHEIHPQMEVPLEEVFGLNQNQFGPTGLRGRGNIFHCTTPRKLIEHRLYLNPTGPALMWFVVYQGSTQQGIYNLVNSISHSGQGPGIGWYSSGAVDFDFVSGMYYAIYTQWDVTANYWTQNPVPPPYPIPCSFGQLQSGVGWNWAPIYGDPPPTTQNVAETFVDPVAYYQTIVTDDIIPVELLSFTYQVDQNNTVLHWVTATETNNQGFEIEKMIADEFVSIAFIEGNGTTTENHRYTYTDRNLAPGIYTYRLKQVDFNGTHYYYDPLFVEIEAPVDFALNQNYPNPFNPTTKIEYSLSVDSRVSLTVYNLLGEAVVNLVNTNVAAGNQEITFDASGLNSGVYFYKLDAIGSDGTSFSSVKKMMLTK
jgi:hypothetical protein